MKETAIVYCENNFGTMDGKTANGLVRSSRKFEIVGVIDSKKAGLDAGECLVGEKIIFLYLKVLLMHLKVYKVYLINSYME